MRKGFHDPQPRRSLTESDDSENGSVLNIENLLFRQRAVSHITSHDKNANVDGSIELVDEKGRPTGMIRVQVKTYQNRYEGAAKHPIPAYIAGYAHNMPGELVMIIVSDFDKGHFFWKVIDEEWYFYFNKTGAQSKTYCFSKDETADKENIRETLNKWQHLYDTKMAVFKNKTEKAFAFIERQKYPFAAISRDFFGVPSSHIQRQETEILKQWIDSPLDKSQKPVMVISGPAGCGKSVVLRDLIDYMDNNGIPYLPIKSDQVESVNPEEICTALSILCKDTGKCVLVIDQLDALSRYMSNDRESLNKILSIIASISKDWPPESIRIIVSCREFDLQNDNRICKVLSNTPIRMGNLTDEEMGQVLEHLSPGLQTRIQPPLKTLLSVPQYLDIFCRVFHQSDHPLTIKTSVDLYDALWHELTHPVHTVNLRAEDIEEVLYSISDAILNAETLNPVIALTGSKARVVEYLESEGIVRTRAGRISFFHQTFYEYVYARSIETHGISISGIVTGLHQGLFLRNTVKQLIDYLKGKDPGRYVQEVSEILRSENVRKHIKTLVLDTMAFSSEISFTEQDLVAELAQSNLELFRYFLRKAWADVWFRPLMTILREFLPDMRQDSPFYLPTIQFLSRFCGKHTHEVFTGMETIQDESTRKDVARYLLWYPCDYNERKVLKWYEWLKPVLPISFRIDCIGQAAKSNLSFALSQAAEIIDMCLGGGKEMREIFHESEHLFKELAKQYPYDFYQILQARLMLYIDHNRFCSYHAGLDSARFTDYYGSESGVNLMKILSSLLKTRESAFRKKEIMHWLSHKEDYSSAVAFEIMAESPTDYIHEVKAILEDMEYTSQILESSESEYWFRLLLPVWYAAIDDDTRIWYQGYLLTFRSPLDKVPAKARNRFRPQLYPFLGEEQWKLIHSLKEEEMDKTLKIKMQELDRRFGGQPDLRKNRHGASAAWVCERLVSSEICMRFSEKRWEEFILKSADYKESRPNGRWFPVDDRLNMEDFTEYVACDAVRHDSLVERIVANPKVKQGFKIAGVKGLAKGGLSPARIEDLLNKVGKIDEHFYDYTEIIELITKDDSEVIDRLLSKLVPLACRGDYNPAPKDGKDNEHKVTDIINHIINTEQGRALHRVIDLAHLDSRRKMIYVILGKIKEKLHPELRMYAIWELYRKEYYDEELFAVLLKDYLCPPAPEFLLLNAQCIYNFYVSHPGISDEYLERVEDIPACHSLLVQIYFLAHNHGRLRSISEQKLHKLIQLKEDYCFRTLAKICIENLGDSDFRDYAIHLLEEILTNDSEAASAAKQLYYASDQFATEDFQLFRKLLRMSNPSARIHGHQLIPYLERCATEYPRECYECLQYIDTPTSDKAHDEESFIVLLLKLYAVLKEKTDRKTMDNLMDIFDRHIVQDNYGFRQALEDMEKEG